MKLTAQQWWDSLTFEEKFYKTIEANYVLEGDTVDNHPYRLTIEQIKKVFMFHLASYSE